MKLRPVLTPLIAPALLLAACSGNTNRGLESVHQPVVSRSDYAFDLSLSGGGLAAGEAQRLAGWMQSLNLGFGDRVSVDDPSGMAGDARAEVASAAARHGLLLADVPPVTAGGVSPGTVRVVVTRMSARVPGCPDHSPYDDVTLDAHTSSNYGCAVNSNLAAMIANPGDLVRGQGPSGNDPATSTKAIDTFRKAVPTGAGGLKAESPSGSSN